MTTTAIHLATIKALLISLDSYIRTVKCADWDDLDEGHMEDAVEMVGAAIRSIDGAIQCHDQNESA